MKHGVTACISHLLLTVSPVAMLYIDLARFLASCSCHVQERPVMKHDVCQVGCIILQSHAPYCRVCRKTVLDETLLIRVPHPNAVALAETMLKAGIHQYPKSEYLLIIQTGYRMSLKNDQPVSFLLLPLKPLSVAALALANHACYALQNLCL